MQLMQLKLPRKQKQLQRRLPNKLLKELEMKNKSRLRQTRNRKREINNQLLKLLINCKKLKHREFNKWQKWIPLHHLKFPNKLKVKCKQTKSLIMLVNIHENKALLSKLIKAVQRRIQIRLLLIIWIWNQLQFQLCFSQQKFKRMLQIKSKVIRHKLLKLFTKSKVVEFKERFIQLSMTWESNY